MRGMWFAAGLVTAGLLGGAGYFVSKSSVACGSPYKLCPVHVDVCRFWTEPPSTLEPGESVVEVSLAGGQAVVLRLPQFGIPRFGSGREGMICTQAVPAIMRRHRVHAVVQGDFRGDYFWILQTESCSYSLRVDDWNMEQGRDRAFMVVRPFSSDTARDMLLRISHVGFIEGATNPETRENIDMYQPLMRMRDAPTEFCADGPNPSST